MKAFAYYVKNTSHIWEVRLKDNDGRQAKGSSVNFLGPFDFINPTTDWQRAHKKKCVSLLKFWLYQRNLLPDSLTEDDIAQMNGIIQCLNKRNRDLNSRGIGRKAPKQPTALKTPQALLVSERPTPAAIMGRTLYTPRHLTLKFDVEESSIFDPIPKLLSTFTRRGAVRIVIELATLTIPRLDPKHECRDFAGITQEIIEDWIRFLDDNLIAVYPWEYYWFRRAEECIHSIGICFKGGLVAMIREKKRSSDNGVKISLSAIEVLDKAKAEMWIKTPQSEEELQTKGIESLRDYCKQFYDAAEQTETVPVEQTVQKMVRIQGRGAEMSNAQDIIARHDQIRFSNNHVQHY